MRGMELNSNLIYAGAEFLHDAKTGASYRMWSIEDRYPAMLRDATSGASISVEIWQLSAEGLMKVLQQEPPGLCLGKVKLQNGDWVLSILGEPFLCEGQQEITQWGGWREYQVHRKG